MTVAVDPSQLGAGSYSGTVTVSSKGSAPVSIPVTLEVAGTPTVQVILNAATFAPTPVSPGLVITLAGTGLGPSAGVSGAPDHPAPSEQR